MVAFIVIGVHNWQTTAPRAAERRQLETSVFLQPRRGAGRLLGVLVSAGWGGEEDWRCGKGSFSPALLPEGALFVTTPPAPGTHIY